MYQVLLTWKLADKAKVKAEKATENKITIKVCGCVMSCVCVVWCDMCVCDVYVCVCVCV